MIDVLVNNAAVSLDGFDGAVVRQTLAVNFFGALNLTEALLPLMRRWRRHRHGVERHGRTARLFAGDPRPLRRSETHPRPARRAGRRIPAAVDAGTHTQAGWPTSAYRVSKAAIIALAKLLARDLAARRIHVNAVCPGWVRTRMGGRSAPRSLGQGAASVVWAAALTDGTTGGFFRDGKPANW